MASAALNPERLLSAQLRYLLLGGYQTDNFHKYFLHSTAPLMEWFRLKFVPFV